jgi:glycosyltransferase involved in cell wall biosynthesis
MNGSKPLVSVIIPTYNRARLILDSIASLQAQTCPDWECIIVDDGSTDDTAAVIRNIAADDVRMRYVRQENRGLSAARNRGLEQVRGRYIQFLDSDDVVLPQKFEAQLALLQPRAEPGVSYCRPMYCVDDALDREVNANRPFAFLDSADPVLDLATRWERELVIPIHCFLFDARLFQGVRFDETLPSHEDWDCWMRLFAQRPTLHFLDAKLAVYRRHAGAMCRDAEQMRAGWLMALRKQHAHAGTRVDLRWALLRRIHQIDTGRDAVPGAFLPPSPRVSVILTSYNYEHFVAEAITSVFRQSYRNLELVIVDDGSKDGSRAVIQKTVVNAPIPVQIIFQENGGQASAFNAAYRMISGDLVTLLDSDDYWYEDRMERMLDFVRLFPGGGVYQHQLETGRGLKRNGLLNADVFQLWRSWNNGVFNIADDHDGVLFSPFLPTSGLLFRRAVTDKVFPVPESLITCPDAYLTRTSAAFGPLYSLPDTLGVWRDHGENAGVGSTYSFQDFWVPVIMSALNDFYARNGLGLRLEHDPAKRSSVPAARILGERMQSRAVSAPAYRPQVPGESPASLRFERRIGDFLRSFLSPETVLKLRRRIKGQ